MPWEGSKTTTLDMTSRHNLGYRTQLGSIRDDTQHRHDAGENKLPTFSELTVERNE